MNTRSPTAIRQRATGAAFAGDGDDNRHGQTRHFAEVARNRFGLPALFRVHPRIRPGRVHKRKDRPVELRGQHITRSALRYPSGFALAEIQCHAFFRVAAFLVTDHSHRPAVKTRHAGHQDGSSPKARSPCSFMKSVKSKLT